MPQRPAATISDDESRQSRRTLLTGPQVGGGSQASTRPSESPEGYQTPKIKRAAPALGTKSVKRRTESPRASAYPITLDTRPSRWRWPRKCQQSHHAIHPSGGPTYQKHSHAGGATDAMHQTNAEGRDR